MREVFTIVLVWFMAFVVCCTLSSVGPAYAYALEIEAAKVYSAHQVGSEWVEVEGLTKQLRGQ